jgi:hypothetical protein
MKLTRVIAVLAILSLVVIPALGEMTDYQKGAMDGMKAGLRMGKLLGAAPYDPSQAQEYNSLVDTFNQGLSALFGENTEAIKMFWMSPYGLAAGAGYDALNNLSFKPVHSIDGSFNQSRKVNPDAQGKIYGYDPDTYYSMVGMDENANIPDYRPYSSSQEAHGNLGGV